MRTDIELTSKFGSVANKPETLSTLQNLMKLYDLDVDELYIKWEQFSYHHKDKYAIDSFSEHVLQDFKEYILQQIGKKANTSIGSIHSTTSSVKKPKILRPTGNSSSIFGLGIPNTPTLKRNRPESGTPNNFSKLNYESTEDNNLLYSSPMQELSLIHI